MELSLIKKNDADLWFSNISNYTERQICNQWKKTAWRMFDDDDYDFKKCKSIKQHFNVVVFEFENEKAKAYSEKNESVST